MWLIKKIKNYFLKKFGNKLYIELSLKEEKVKVYKLDFKKFHIITLNRSISKKRADLIADILIKNGIRCLVVRS